MTQPVPRPCTGPATGWPATTMRPPTRAPSAPSATGLRHHLSPALTRLTQCSCAGGPSATGARGRDERGRQTVAERETWTVEQCAEAWRVKPSTWRYYVHRGLAPQPLPGYDDDRKRRWDPGAVMTFPRPGQGRRTDLQAAVPTPPPTTQHGETAAQPEC